MSEPSKGRLFISSPPLLNTVGEEETYPLSFCPASAGLDSKQPDGAHAKFRCRYDQEPRRLGFVCEVSSSRQVDKRGLLTFAGGAATRAAIPFPK